MDNLAIKIKWFCFGLGLVMIGAAAGSYFSDPQSYSNGWAPPAHAVAQGDPANIFTKIAKEETPAVVNISTKQKVKAGVYGDEQMREFYEKFFPWFKDIPKEQTRQSLGSGFIVEDSGYILTNNHVVEQADEIIVTFGDGHGGAPEKEYPAKLIAADPKIDIALIKIEPAGKLPTLRLGDSDKVQVGEWVMAIGNPFGFSQSVTVGVVSAKGRVIGASLYDDFIQTDASINPGNSGGPLLNIGGEVIGINSAIFTGGMSQGNIGIGFAVPINAVKAIYNDLKKGKVKRGWLGVKIQTITPDLQSALGLDSIKGSLISEVIKESPADKAGMKSGDVIIEFGGEEVPSTTQLPRMVGAEKPGAKIKVKVVRNGQQLNLTVELGEMPDAKAMAAVEPAEDVLGMSVSDITPELAQRYSVKQGEGVIVAGLAQGGAAMTAGIRTGDVIAEVNRKPTNDVKSYNDAISKAKPGDAVLMLVKRGEGSSFIAVKIPEKETKE